MKPLDDVTATFGPGVNGLVGPNGAGKTSLLNVVSGFYRPASGRIHVDGIDLGSLPPHKRARAGVRRTFQQEQVIRELSAHDNVLLAAESLGLGRGDVAEVLDEVGLSNVSRRATDLNMMERRLVEIAKALLGKPRVILLDEPGAGLAEADTACLVPLVRRMAERNDAAVVLIDHDMELVSSVCSAVTVLDFGRLIAHGPTAEVLASSQVRRAYLGTEEVA
ncbi:ABC transporter ATP-binding protein [Streptomyces sp. NPDC058335]|uniref:ABC transporter ATP-binding protein n=1 Tax=Streptomyces sp. NPDC058335 TaxID=3346451 RepID=UPI00364F678A